MRAGVDVSVRAGLAVAAEVGVRVDAAVVAAGVPDTFGATTPVAEIAEVGVTVHVAVIAPESCCSGLSTPARVVVKVCVGEMLEEATGVAVRAAATRATVGVAGSDVGTSSTCTRPDSWSRVSPIWRRTRSTGNRPKPHNATRTIPANRSAHSPQRGPAGRRVRPQWGHTVNPTGTRPWHDAHRTESGDRPWRAPHSGQISTPCCKGAPQRLHSICLSF